jgi:hypothetical protein
MDQQNGVASSENNNTNDKVSWILNNLMRKFLVPLEIILNYY